MSKPYPIPRASPVHIALWTVVIAALVFLIVLAATHGNSDSSLKAGEVEVTILVPGGGRAAAMYDEVIPAFEKANPGIKIRRYDIPSQGEFVKLQIMIAAGSAPDIVPIMSMRLPQFLEHNAFLPLNDFMDNDPDFLKRKADIYPQTYQGFTRDGKLYGFAYSQNNYALYFNKDIFDDYNKTAPPGEKISYPNSSWTLDYYLDVCKKLTRDTHHDGQIDQWGTITQDAPFYIICPILRRFGADLFNADKTRCTLDDPKAIAAMQWYFDLAHKNGVAPSPGGADARGSGTVAINPSDVFAAGKIAMFEAEGEWRYDFADKITTFKWDIAEPPMSLDGSHTSGWECFAMAITRNSKHPREAWKFISFLLSSEGQKIVLTNNVGIPVLKSLCTSPDWFLSPEKPPEHKEVYLRTMEYGQDIPGLKNFEEVEDAIKSQLQRGLQGNTPAEECCRAAAKEANRLLAENREE